MSRLNINAKKFGISSILIINAIFSKIGTIWKERSKKSPTLRKIMPERSKNLSLCKLDVELEILSFHFSDNIPFLITWAVIFLLLLSTLSKRK